MNEHKVIGFAIQLLGFSLLYLGKILFDTYYTAVFIRQGEWMVTTPGYLRHSGETVFCIGLFVLFYGISIFANWRWWEWHGVYQSTLGDFLG